MTKDIVLIGMPGCGKSTIGKKLAATLHCPFLDLDAVIEETAGMTINGIFEKMGESVFRKMETEALKNTIGFGGVLATGGGIVTMPENREIVSQGLVIFLDRPLTTILDTISTAERPLLKDSKERLVSLYEQRYDLYRDWAEICVANTGNMEETVEKIINEVKDNENYGN